MSTICLFIKFEKTVYQKAKIFKNWLHKKGHTVIQIQNKHSSKMPHCKPNKKILNDILCVFVLGGDGTFLSAVRWMGKKQIPIIGIKFGEVGFLSETTEKHIYTAVKLILNKKITIQPRMRLSIKVKRKGIEITKGSSLNDVVINKGALARLTRIRTRINGKFFTDYRADGLIIATPTGSTAYSLAAGGPIVDPSISGILITPICPFTLTNRPLITQDKAIIEINLIEKSSDIMLTFDGQIGSKINQQDSIIIKKSNYPVKMITLPDQDYFDILKTKLKWS